MAKISSSQPPRGPKPSGEASSRPQRSGRTSSSSRIPRASASSSSSASSSAPEALRADRGDGHDGAGPFQGEGGGPTTLGEALGRERELREDLHAFRGGEKSPWGDAQSEREDKQRADEHFKRHERVQQKGTAPRPAGRGAGSGRDERSQASTPSRAPHRQAGSDGFDGLQPRMGRPAGPQSSNTAGAKGPALTAPPSPLGGAPIAPALPRRLGGGAIHTLNNAKDPGIFFREEGREDGRGEESEDPELAAAVEETIRLLFGVRGIHRVGPGVDHAGQQIIVISTARGFNEVSMRAIPDRVHRFRTLVALPYELLPLRREIP